MLLLGDWSNPGSAGVYTGVDAGLFYTGGNTPHVWTLAQIRRQTCRYLIPAWVYDPARPGAASGTAGARALLAAARAAGMHAGRVVIDMETWADYAYTLAFRNEIAAQPGWWTTVYGSASSVFRNYCPGGGWWIADWTGHPFEHPGAHVWATQYASAAQAGKPWDLSEMTSTAHLWEAKPPPAQPRRAYLFTSPPVSVVSTDGGQTWKAAA